MHYLLLTAALLSTAVQAHLSMVKPAPINYKGNKYTITPDYDYSSPLANDGSNYPCKNYHKLLNSPEGTPIETWAAGSVQTFTTGDGTGAAHGGGSCQASISEDGGLTFKVVKSFIGNCPVQGQSYSFTVPTDTKAGTALFAWTWFNKIGNREMYMNCAAITITGGSGAGLSAYPDVFKANIGGSCSTPADIDVVFPNPGKDVETAQGSKINLKPPNGECGAGTAPNSPATSTSSATPTAPVASAPVASAPVSQAGGCVCSCGGPNGYIVNIKPAGPVPEIAEMSPRPSASITSAPSATSTTVAAPDASGVEGSVDTAPTGDSFATVYRRRISKYSTTY